MMDSVQGLLAWNQYRAKRTIRINDIVPSNVTMEALAPHTTLLLLLGSILHVSLIRMDAVYLVMESFLV